MSPAPERGGQEERRSPEVSPTVVPLLFGGLLLGFALGYFLVWWGLVVIALLGIGALSLVLSGTGPRDGIGAGLVGTLLGFVGILAVALFRGGL